VCVCGECVCVCVFCVIHTQCPVQGIPRHKYSQAWTGPPGYREIPGGPVSFWAGGGSLGVCEKMTSDFLVGKSVKKYL